MSQCSSYRMDSVACTVPAAHNHQLRTSQQQMIVFKPPPPKMQHTQSEGVSEGGRGREGEKEGGREGRESGRKEGREGEKEGGRDGREGHSVLAHRAVVLVPNWSPPLLDNHLCPV